MNWNGRCSMSSNPIVTGIRLLRAVWRAQRTYDAAAKFGPIDSWLEARKRLAEAEHDYEVFMTGADEDFKHAQGNDR
jgi:hypothetical protein